MMTTTTTIISQTVLFLTRQKYPLKYSYMQCSFQVLPSYLVAEIRNNNIWTPQIFNLLAKNKIITVEKNKIGTTHARNYSLCQWSVALHQFTF